MIVLPKTLDQLTLLNAEEVLTAERKIRELRIAEQEALTAKAEAERNAQQTVALNVQQAHGVEQKLRALQLAAQQALTEKAQIELRTHKLILELTEEHKRTVRLPELKLSS